MSEEARGPVILREKPKTDLKDVPAYAIPEDATLDDFEGAAAWVRFRGGEVKVCDTEGLLVVSTYPSGSRYHEWVEEASLLVHNTDHNEFTVYGVGMADHYLVEPTADDAAGGH